MAYYGSGFYDGEIGEYHYDVVPYQDPLTFPYSDSYDPTNHNAYSYSEFDNSAYIHSYPRDAYDSYYNHPEMNYSVYTLSEPKLIMYEPVPYENCYVLSQPNYLISYSTKMLDDQFSEPDFEDYDPTPYDGGYDISLTYGKPLPPSDKICYPRSEPDPNVLPISDNISIQTIPSATPENEDTQGSETPINAIVKIDDTEIGNNNGDARDSETPSNLIVKVDDIDNVSIDGSDDGESLELEQVEDREVDYTFSTYSDYGYDYPWPGYDYGKGQQVCERDYNSDVVELCESLFGHWPCLGRMKQISNGIKEDVGNRRQSNKNPWETSAEYIFGDPLGN